MSVLRMSQFNDYPMFLFDVALGGDSPETAEHIAFWVSDFSGVYAGGKYPPASGILPTFDATYGGGLPASAIGGFTSGDPDAVYTALVSAIATWAEGYDWSPITGGAVTGLTVTRYDEAPTDVTPA